MFLLHFVFSVGAVRVRERGQLADHRADRKYKIAITKWNNNIESELNQSKNPFSDTT